MSEGMQQKGRSAGTSLSSSMLISRSEFTIATIGMMKAKEPPMTVGSRVPNVVWNSVLMPDTNRIV